MACLIIFSQDPRANSVNIGINAFDAELRTPARSHVNSERTGRRIIPVLYMVDMVRYGNGSELAPSYPTVPVCGMRGSSYCRGYNNKKKDGKHIRNCDRGPQNIWFDKCVRPVASAMCTRAELPRCNEHQPICIPPDFTECQNNRNPHQN